jgi:hypothetical protein
VEYKEVKINIADIDEEKRKGKESRQEMKIFEKPREISAGRVERGEVLTEDFIIPEDAEGC